jgi:FkbM family methyltransferase
MAGIMRIALGTGRFVAGRLMPRRPYPVLTGPLKGTRIILGSLSGDGGGASVYFNRVEPGQTAAFVKELKPGHTIFDIGANVGYYTMLASRLIGPAGFIAAFEPLMRNMSYLQQHLEINSIDNARALPFAVSDRSGIASFDTGSDSAMGMLNKNGDILVPTISLDEAADRLGAKPDVLKIDVEGAEMGVLDGGANIIEKARPIIFLSTHSPKLRENCLERLDIIGYDVAPLSGGDDPHEFLARPRGRMK